MVKVSLRDNEVREYPAGTRIADIVEDLGGRLKKEALAALVNGVVCDLSFQLQEDARVEFLTLMNRQAGRFAGTHKLSLPQP